MVARYSLRCRCEGAARSNLLVLLLFSTLLFGCRPATPPPSPADQTQVASTTREATPAAAKPTAVPDEVMEILNGKYQLGATDALEIVQLTDGNFERGTRDSDDYLSVTVTDFAAAGDLDEDNTEEVAVLVSENYGGSGTFVFLALYAKVDGTMTFQTSTLVDDRPKLNTLSIDKSEVFLDATIHGVDEPLCCPTLKTIRHYRLMDNLLDMTDYTTFTPEGKPRTISIESPVSGSDVYSSFTLRGSVAIAPSNSKLTYRVRDVGGVELSIGTIPVTASGPAGPGTFNAVIPIGNILSGTVVQIEVQDISAEDGSLLAMDSVELVVK